MKIILIIIGIGILLLGLFLTFGILVYSLKEKDNDVFYGYLISTGLIVLGIYLLVRGLKIKLKNK